MRNVKGTFFSEKEKTTTRSMKITKGKFLFEKTNIH